MRPPDCSSPLSSYLVLVVLLSFLTTLLVPVEARQSSSDNNDGQLLDATKSSIAAMSSPGNFYFLEFPLKGENDDDRSTDAYMTLQPKCGDGSPYSFVFRRGSDRHVNKLIVELEGGPACWNPQNCGCSHQKDYKRQAPWYDYLQNKQEAVVEAGGYFPPLNTCSGITSGFTKEGAKALFGQKEIDIPIGLRAAGLNGTKDEWWEFLSGGNGRTSSSDSLNGDVYEWSYLLLPHCTMDWHLGHQPRPQPTGCDDGNNNERVYHRGGANLQAVIDWVNDQFVSTGLEALVTVSGGSVAGCDPSEPQDISSIAPIIFANGIASDRLTQTSTSDSMLAIVEGTGLWSDKLPNHDTMIHRWNARDLTGDLKDTAKSLMTTSSPPSGAVKYAWSASETGSSINSDSNQESQWLNEIKSTARPNSFHIYTPSRVEASSPTCPRFAFPDTAEGEELIFSSFIRNVASQMSWSTPSNVDSKKNKVRHNNRVQGATEDVGGIVTRGEKGGVSRLSFFSVVVIFVCLLILCYVVYYIVNNRNTKQHKPPPPSPYELWLTALTHHPRIFLATSLFIPILLSCLAVANSGFSINLDFNMYLNISSEIEEVARSYNIEIDRQVESLEQEQRNCAVMTGRPLPRTQTNGPRDRKLHAEEMLKHFGKGDKFFSNYLPTHYEDEFEFDDGDQHRNLQAFGPFITFMYTNRNGGNVLEPKVLQQIRDFEQSIMDFPGFFPKYCYGLHDRCMPFDSVIPRYFPSTDGLYPGTEIAGDVNGITRSFTSDATVLWKMDQYFGPGNLRSNVTRTFVWLRDLGDGGRQVNHFLEKMYKEFWKTDQKRPYKYPDLVFTWANGHLERTEAEKALTHDAIWSAGSLIFIGVMIFLKVRNIFVFFCGMFGLVLAFSTAYYWVAVRFDIQQITLLHVSSLFVMLGIGADDIFLMIDSFEHTKLEFNNLLLSSDDCQDNDDVENLSEDEDETELGQQRYAAAAADVIRKRMKSAYSTAGSMMLVSSLTTAVCFFSNAFGVLVIIQEFGVYMGMVVLVNYVHVMTVLPSSIMVYELYIVPWKKNRPPSNWTFRNLKTKLFGASTANEPDPLTKISEKNDGIELVKNDKTDETTEKTEIFGDSQSCLLSIESDGDSASRTSAGVPYLSGQNSVLLGSIAEDSTISPGDENSAVLASCDALQVNRLDRWLVEKYTPFLTARYTLFVYLSLTLAVLLGGLGIAFFEMSSGSIVLFSDKYNLGRLQSVNDAYYNNDISKTVESADIRGWMENSASGNGATEGTGESNSSTGEGIGIGSGGGNPGNGSGGAVPPVNGGEGGSSGGIDGPIMDPVQPTPRPVQQPTLPPTPEPIPEPTPAPTLPPTYTKVPTAAPVEGGFGVVVDVTAPQETLNPAEAPADTMSPEGGIFLGSPPVPLSPVATNPLAPTHAAPLCAEPCQNGGTCTFEGECYCPNGWDGPVCSIPVCPIGDNRQTCSGNGACIQRRGIKGSTMCDCNVDFQGSLDCGKRLELARREAIVVRLIWGVEPDDDASNLWIIRSEDSRSERSSKSSHGVGRKGGSRAFDLSEPDVQGWLYETVKMARNDTELKVQPDRPTWIEIFRSFVLNQGLEFPVPKDLFVGYLELLKKENFDFAEAIKKEIGTSSPGLAGDFTFTSITMYADVFTSETAVSFTAFDSWSRFVNHVNDEKPDDVARVFVQSRAFLDAYRAEQTVDSTLATWFVANGLCLLIIAVFSQNLLLCLMVMVTITLIFLCLGGLLFAVFRLPFGPVEALGVSIFIGLSANYSLHVVHAYHCSNKNNRQQKMEDAIFAVGSPIVASALSTIGGSIFLFGCRTYVFVELGILMCSITTMALVFSMGFLVAWLKMIGPLPCDNVDNINQEHRNELKHGHRVHYWDLKALYNAMFHTDWKAAFASFREMRP